MQEKILLFFQNIATPILDQMAEIITMCGEETLVIVIVVMIYWCLDKKKGLVISASLITSLIGMSTLKAIVRHPRPWVVLDSINAKRMQTATGYSFPSGHTTTAASFYSSLAFNYRKKWISVICAILIVLVGLSRLYLGVHWPLDVAGGLILGITVTIVLTQRLEKLFNDEKKTKLFALIYGLVSAVVGLVLGILVTVETADATAFTDFAKTLGLSGGAFIGFLLEQRFGKFSVEGKMWIRVLRLLIGVGTMVLLKSGLKAVFPDAAVFSWLRYLILGFWMFGLYPLIGVKSKLFSQAD